jgi:hypothetical protein
MPRARTEKGSFPPALCAAFKAGKECNDSQCTSSHFFRPCNPCKRMFYSDYAYRSHINGNGHKRREAKIGTPFQPKRNKKATVLCSVCQVYVKVDYMAKHEEKTGHLRQVRFHKFQDLLKEAEKDKNGVIVEGEFDFGVVELTEMGPCLERGGTVSTMSSDVNVTLLEASLGSRTKEQKPSYVLIRCSNVNDLTMIQLEEFYLQLRRI